ncbi:Phosphoenolpyruvate/pyruvate domain-containing protein [Ramaria rubella]|nr:Phosphoenolpyruvate/pyruvate domain-containing protein [Ramaria rubella]
MTQNALAQTFAALHKPGDPIVLANAFDSGSASALGNNTRVKAIGSASFAIAVAAGVADAELTLEQNLASIPGVIAAGVKAGKPVTVDLQDGYGDHLEDAITKVIGLGAVGANIEDFDRQTNALWSVKDASERVRRAKKAAAAAGVPDFVINARTDSLFQPGGTLEHAIERGKAYLAAGATTAFVWGGGKGTSSEQIKRLVKEFDGRLNVMARLTPGSLTVKELREIGVARISVGPALYFLALKAYEKGVDSLLDS